MIEVGYIRTLPQICSASLFYFYYQLSVIDQFTGSTAFYYKITIVRNFVSVTAFGGYKSIAIYISYPYLPIPVCMNEKLL